MPIKGVFSRFNGFSQGGWYQYTTFLFRRLKSPENTLKRSLGIFTIFISKILSKNTIPTPPKERPQRAFLGVLTAFLIEGGIIIPLFNFEGLNRLKKPLNAVLGFFTIILTKVLTKSISRFPFKSTSTHPQKQTVLTSVIWL